MPIRWKLKADATRLWATLDGAQGTLRGSQLIDSHGNILMTTSCLKKTSVNGWSVEGWYWRGYGQNTSDKPLCATEKEARKEARAYYDSVTK